MLAQINKIVLADGLEKSHAYGCVMVRIDRDSQVGRTLATMRDAIDTADLAAGGLETDSHVTVRYGILPGSDLSGVRRYLAGLTPFAISFGAVSVFPPTEQSDNAAVVKVEVISTALESINAELPEHVAFKPANFDYHPHLTLAFVKPDAADKYAGDESVRGQSAIVDAIVIANMDETVRLAGAPAPPPEKAARQRFAKRTPEHPDVTAARQQMQASIQHFLTAAAKEIAAAVRESGSKASKAAGRTTSKFLASLPAIKWDALASTVRSPLTVVAQSGARHAVAMVSTTDTQLIADANEVAADWAAFRAAELVGMRRLSTGRLIQNPDARYAITERTRSELRQIITDAFESQTTMDDLAVEIETAGAFSAARAEMIARTETSRAAAQGNLAGWKTSGMVEMLNWALSADHDDASDCECSDNADNGPYELHDLPELPAHPNCTCNYTIAQLTGQDVPEREDDEEED